MTPAEIAFHTWWPEDRDTLNTEFLLSIFEAGYKAGAIDAMVSVVVDTIDEDTSTGQGSRMTVYLAFKDTNTLMSGNYEECLGVFDTPARAWTCLKRGDRDFKHATPTPSGGRTYHFDGETSYHWRVKKAELNKPFSEVTDGVVSDEEK